MHVPCLYCQKCGESRDAHTIKIIIIITEAAACLSYVFVLFVMTWLSQAGPFIMLIFLWWHWLELWLICQCRTISAPQRAPIHCTLRHIIDVAYSPRTWKYEHKRTTWQREKVEHNALSTYAVRGYIYIFGWCAGVYMKRLEYDLWCAKYCALKNVANRCDTVQMEWEHTNQPQGDSLNFAWNFT